MIAALILLSVIPWAPAVASPPALLDGIGPKAWRATFRGRGRLAVEREDALAGLGVLFILPAPFCPLPPMAVGLIVMVMTVRFSGF